MPGLFVRAGELGADLVGFGMLDVLVDGERLPPGLPRPRQFAGGMAVSRRWVRASASAWRSPSSRAMLSARW